MVVVDARRQTSDGVLGFFRRAQDSRFPFSVYRVSHRGRDVRLSDVRGLLGFFVRRKIVVSCWLLAVRESCLGSDIGKIHLDTAPIFLGDISNVSHETMGNLLHDRLCFPLTVFHARLSWRTAFLPHVYPLRRFNKSRSVFSSL